MELQKSLDLSLRPQPLDPEPSPLPLWTVTNLILDPGPLCSELRRALLEAWAGQVCPPPHICAAMEEPKPPNRAEGPASRLSLQAKWCSSLTEDPTSSTPMLTLGIL